MIRGVAATMLVIVLAATAALAQDEPVELPVANPSFEEDGSFEVVLPVFGAAPRVIMGR